MVVTWKQYSKVYIPIDESEIVDDTPNEANPYRARG